jgi:asparagine synthase (glutamine-hydrolysing)
MMGAIAHRGPDSDGHWTDAAEGIAIGHRRLAILDLSPQGHQPMVSESGRYVIAFNGEIYNHIDLREQLASQGIHLSWRGHSDTETLLACIEAWGFETTLRASAGMFAIALWDRHACALTLARDRFGEKPLYYGWQGETFLFSSELKALKRHPEFIGRVNRDSVSLLLQYNYIPAPFSIWEGISKLLPGTYVTARRDSVDAPRTYWSLAQVAESGARNPLRLNDSEAVDHVDSVLRSAVRQQMISDVPLGALLSGGIDSSTVVALMQAESRYRVRTFSIGFHESQFDESQHAAAVAAHLGTDHTTLFMSASDVLDAVPRLPRVYDEPFADSSQLPTCLVMSLARQKVTVALSGDAGDELFGGYNRYTLAPRIWNIMRWLPAGARAAISRTLLSKSPEDWARVAGPFAARLGQANLGDKLHKLGQRLQGSHTFDDLYRALVCEWGNASELVLGCTGTESLLGTVAAWPDLTDPAARMMAVDSMTYLPDDILVKVDRAAMAVSMETRAPFLDHRVAELAWRLPLHQKIRRGQGKWVLRQLLYRHVPQSIVDRPKMGFGIPLNEWLRGPLRDWAEALLDESRLRQDGYFDPKPIRRAWEQHLTGNSSFGYRLWSVLMFQSWLGHESRQRSSECLLETSSEL